MPNIIHSSPKTKNFYCDGKGCFEVLVRRKNHQDVERYWCGQLHGYFDPRKVDERKCPKYGMKAPKAPKFNRGRLEL